MLKVLVPNKNKLTQGYSDKHKGYDHSGKGDQNYYSSFYGRVVQAKNSETKNWINKGTLTTNDYGNYIKIKGEVDGKTVYQLGAHFKAGTVLPQGAEVQRGQVVAQIGNTGNSTGAHSHTEYRDENNHNMPVSFVQEVEEPDNQMQTEEQIIIDVYKATTGEYPSDDEKKARLQEHKNTVELIEDRLRGDGRAKKKWLAEWEVQEADDIDYKTAVEQYKSSYDELKMLLGLRPGDNTEDVLGAISGLQDRVKQLEKATAQQTIYKYDGKDYEKIIRISNILIVLEKGVIANGKTNSK